MNGINPYGPYSVEELSSMDDAELGRLYRRKNKDVDSGMTAFLGTFSSRYRLRKRSELGYDAFDNLYPESYPYDSATEKFRTIFDYLTYKLKGVLDRVIVCKRFHNHRWFGLLNWMAMFHDAHGNLESYEDADVGRLLKNCIPVMEFLVHSGEPLDNLAFRILDEEYNLIGNMRTFMMDHQTEPSDTVDYETYYLRLPALKFFINADRASNDFGWELDTGDLMGDIEDFMYDMDDLIGKTARNDMIGIPGDHMTAIRTLMDSTGYFAHDTEFEKDFACMQIRNGMEHEVNVRQFVSNSKVRKDAYRRHADRLDRSSDYRRINGLRVRLEASGDDLNRTIQEIRE